MWLGIVLGLFYSVWGFGRTGEAPRLAMTVGPFVNGHLIVCGYRIHHWFVYFFVSIWYRFRV